jgi:hypothetical protein
LLTSVAGQSLVGEAVVQAWRERAGAQGLGEVSVGFGEDVAAGEDVSHGVDDGDVAPARRTPPCAFAKSPPVPSPSTATPAPPP